MKLTPTGLIVECLACERKRVGCVRRGIRRILAVIVFGEMASTELMPKDLADNCLV